MRKSLCFAAGITLALFSACTSRPTVEGEKEGRPIPNAGDAGPTRPEEVLDLVDASAERCEPTNCKQQSAECGLVGDGCGDIVDCGECTAGAFCGVLQPNTCASALELCVPLSSEAACASAECGVVGDGCGATIDCGGCADDEVCGLLAPFECAPKPVLTADACPALLGDCESQGVECGLLGNGCGGSYDCDAELGGCSASEVCGAETSGRCAVVAACEPTDIESACAGRCGKVSNGCGIEVNGGVHDCNAAGFGCAAGDICGGAGVPNECASADVVCEPKAAAALCESLECGATTDGCDGSVTCGECGQGEICRNNRCQATCEPLGSAEACADKQCGLVSDGCGGSIECGSCGADEACGLFEPFQCGRQDAMCQALSPEDACAGRECGLVLDGCSTTVESLIDCESLGSGCDAGEACGVVAPYQCDDPLSACQAASSCAELGWECGIAIDECGNTFDCAAEGLGCNAELETCIGGRTGPARCLAAFETDDGGGCPLCDAIPNCFGQPQPTTLAGRVVTPGRSSVDFVNQVGVPNAFVYILQTNDLSDVPSIDTGIPQTGGDYGTACERCDDQDLGPVLVSTTTNAFGQFFLRGSIPVDEEFILVVKTGKWRRAQRVTLASDAACATTQLTYEQTRLPRNMGDGLAANIPKVAVSTGRVDAIECVFSKLGVDNAEFTLPGSDGSGSGRIHMYRADVAGGAQMGGGTASASALHSSQERLFSYDMVVFDCQASAVEHNTSDPNVREFVNRGGRLFASHWSYTWLHDNGSQTYADALLAGDVTGTGLSGAADWIEGLGTQSQDTGYVSIDRPGANGDKANAFALWAFNEAAATINADGRYTFEITDPRDLASKVGSDSEEFVFRFLDDAGTNNFCRPCAELTAETCDINPSCKWQGGTCSAVNNCLVKTEAACVLDSQCDWSGSACSFKYDCDSGSVDNNNLAGCFERAQCGWAGTTVQQFSFNTPYAAPEDEICGRVAYSGFHVVSEAGSDYAGVVFPEHCAGVLSDQEKVLLYMLFDLGACVSDQQAAPPECSPITALSCDGRCGPIADGCGGTLVCGGCAGGLACHPGGVCLEPTCKPATCDELGAECGAVADGCGEVIQCGDCAPGTECGLASPNVCTAVCPRLDEAEVCPPGVCGFVSNGCDGVVSCGGCEAGQSCREGACSDDVCVPLTECPSEAECGTISDGCAGALDCGGECELPDVCGGGGQANICGRAECEAISCADLGAECGVIGDGCGGTRDCGECSADKVCGSKVPNICGGCEPLTCEKVGAECGLIGDGCGGQLDCGACEGGLFCGGQAANRCSSEPTCKPSGCDDAVECGVVGDGCGGVVECGECPADEVCGAEESFRCGEPAACVPRTCADVEADCGYIGDGCGEAVQCGECSAGLQCGRYQPNRCPSPSDDPH